MGSIVRRRRSALASVITLAALLLVVACYRAPGSLSEDASFSEQLVILYNEEGTKEWRSWKGDQQCAGFTVRLGRNLPSILLLSYPRSGGTWLRYLLEGATGVFTGSSYTDPRLPKLGFLGESESSSSGTTLLIREHFYYRQNIDPDFPVVLIIRDPRDSLASYHSYQVGLSSFTYKGSESDFKRPGFNVPGMLKQWECVASNRLRDSSNLHIIVYEDLKANPILEVKRLLKFLRVPEDPSRLDCLANHIEGPVNRGQPKLVTYSREQKALFAEAVRRVSALLVQRGHLPLPY